MMQLYKPVKFIERFRKNNDLTAFHSHKRKKYFSLMLVPSYSSGKTRSIRISSSALYAVLYAALFVVLTAIILVSGFYIRAASFRRAAAEFSASLEQAQEAYVNLRITSEKEQNWMMEDIIYLQFGIADEMFRSVVELRQQHQAYMESLESVWSYAEGLEMRLRQYEVYNRELIEVLSENAHIPAVSNLINDIHSSQMYLIAVLEELSRFSAAVQEGETMRSLTRLLVASPHESAHNNLAEYAARDLIRYITLLDLALEVQEEFFVHLNEQIGIAATQIRRDRYGPKLLEWSYVRTILPRNTPVMITDVRTGITYWVNSFSHGSHADVFPVSPEDTAIIHSTFNNRWTWNTRPIWVHIDGRKIAASINGMPHGGGVNRDNNMNGHLCIHFRGSRTHSGSAAHERDHQNSVTEAYRANF